MLNNIAQYSLFIYTLYTYTVGSHMEQHTYIALYIHQLPSKPFIPHACMHDGCWAATALVGGGRIWYIISRLPVHSMHASQMRLLLLSRYEDLACHCLWDRRRGAVNLLRILLHNVLVLSEKNGRKWIHFKKQAMVFIIQRCYEVSLVGWRAFIIIIISLLLLIYFVLTIWMLPSLSKSCISSEPLRYNTATFFRALTSVTW